MFDLKVFVLEDGYAYESSVCGVLVGPKGSYLTPLQHEWRETTFIARTYTRKGEVRVAKERNVPTIGFADWLIKEKGFSRIDDWEVLYD